MTDDTGIILPHISEKIDSAYAISNIIICETADLYSDRFIWLASMGMMDTLNILGIEAIIWDDYDG